MLLSCTIYSISIIIVISVQFFWIRNWSHRLSLIILLFLFLLGRRSSKNLRLRRFKSDRDEICQGSSTSKYARMNWLVDFFDVTSRFQDGGRDVRPTLGTHVWSVAGELTWTVQYAAEMITRKRFVCLMARSHCRQKVAGDILSTSTFCRRCGRDLAVCGCGCHDSSVNVRYVYREPRGMGAGVRDIMSISIN